MDENGERPSESAGLTLLRRLEVVVVEVAPADRVDVARLAVHPLIVFAAPSVEVDANQTVHYVGHCAATDLLRVHQVDALQLHAGLERILKVLLLERNRLTSIRVSS